MRYMFYVVCCILCVAYFMLCVARYPPTSLRFACEALWAGALRAIVKLQNFLYN